MIAKEGWEEKCIGRRDVLSAWVLVLIESAVVLVVFGLIATASCGPDEAMPFGTGAAQEQDGSHALLSSQPADAAPKAVATHRC
jgi:hypothetical protein